jgi:hypothetical protein
VPAENFSCGQNRTPASQNPLDKNTAYGYQYGTKLQDVVTPTPERGYPR